MKMKMKMPLLLAKSSSKCGGEVRSSTFTKFETSLTHDKIDLLKKETMNTELVAQHFISVMGCGHQTTILESV